MRQKGFAPIIFIILTIVLLGVLGYIAYLKGYLNLNTSKKIVFNSTPTPTETLQNTPSQVEEWKTYRSDDLGFEFKYPISWQIISLSSTSLTLSNKYSDSSLNGTTPLPDQIFLHFGLNHASLENYSSTKRSYEIVEGVEVIEQGRYINDNSTFGVVSLYRADDEILEYEEVINQIISSIKFFDITE